MDAEGKWWNVASQGQGSGYPAVPLPLVTLMGPLSLSHSVLLRPLPGCIPGLSRTEGHKNHTNSKVFIFSKKPTSKNWYLAICLRVLAHSKFSDSPFLISAEDWQLLQKQDSDVGVGRQEQEMEVCCLNIFCTPCKQIEAQLPQIALLTTLTSGTPLCFLG